MSKHAAYVSSLDTQIGVALSRAAAENHPILVIRLKMTGDYDTISAAVFESLHFGDYEVRAEALPNGDVNLR